MKSARKYLIFIASLCLGYGVFAQSENIKEYRILAVSNLDDELSASSNSVKSELPLSIFMPNAFSPNGDGLNDTFGLVGDGVETFRLMIFNRWGELVFETNSKSNRWDGTYKGKQAPIGVYAYELIAKSAKNVSVARRGSVTLVN